MILMVNYSFKYVLKQKSINIGEDIIIMDKQDVMLAILNSIVTKEQATSSEEKMRDDLSKKLNEKQLICVHEQEVLTAECSMSRKAASIILNMLMEWPGSRVPEAILTAITELTKEMSLSKSSLEKCMNQEPHGNGMRECKKVYFF